MTEDTKDGLLAVSAVVGTVLGLTLVFLVGTMKGIEGRTLVENEAIDRGYAHIVLRDGQRKFEWVERDDLRKKLAEGRQ